MTVEEALLIVLTVAVVLLVAVIVTVLVVLWQVLKKFRKATDEIRRLTEQSTSAAERFAPLGITIVSLIQIVRVVRKLMR